MIIAMAGLPGTGKSTLARSLAEKLPAIVFNKDTIRAALFPAEEIDHSYGQDDFVVNILLKAAEYCFQKDPEKFAIIDGRTFTKKVQVDALVKYANDFNRELKIISCTCSDKVARARIEHDMTANKHPASDRDFSLYQRLKVQSEPLQYPHLSVDTSNSLESCVISCLHYLQKSNPTY